jgi:hypothetical protein
MGVHVGSWWNSQGCWKREEGAIHWHVLVPCNAGHYIPSPLHHCSTLLPPPPPTHEDIHSVLLHGTAGTKGHTVLPGLLSHSPILYHHPPRC